MSDLATNQNEEIHEPDEEALISALRNQDDIPILMDVVTDPDSEEDGVSQEEHFVHSVEDIAAQAKSSVDDVAVAYPTSPEALEYAIASVLEKRLPELVAEVIQVMQVTGSKHKN
ncbi:hypothetical protein [Marinomonas posidonica]|uniref:Uncharacterized protein n=1 Tax=Marinomonas posidonica (strain CECT 7376 / NCIMB 14433 / IVIA-Po-181) TaxID=491952 RepID=F6CXR7_MARPP|nr:hypothetical protein [Marinomonas posidonica]AEF53380.1 hypothetical protein Mar181_0314 [Marinomonas posidonica IVIA-Po-181]